MEPVLILERAPVTSDPEVDAEVRDAEEDSRDARLSWSVSRKERKGAVESNGAASGIQQHCTATVSAHCYPECSQQQQHAYNMSHSRRGRCLVFNNKVFDVRSGLPVRDGTDLDAQRALATFSALGFDVSVHTDLSAEQMTNTVRRLGAADHSDSDCVAVVVLSHGSEGGVVYGRDGGLALDTLVTPLKGGACPSLVGKPKLFFIQACRGERFDDGTDQIDADDVMVGWDETDLAPPSRLPQEADIFFAFSTVSGYYSWRSGATGSYFIQALCDQLDRHATQLDLARVLTRVNQQVATQFDSCVRARPEQHRKKQMPSVLSTLTRDLYLTPKRLTTTV